MRDLSLHIMDLVQNSVRAGARLVRIEMTVDRGLDELILTIEDDGCGMPPELLEQVRSPFATTRTTRRFGLGIPLFEASAVQSGGSIELVSTAGRGTRIAGRFVLSNVDRSPLGDLTDAMIALIVSTPRTPDYVFTLIAEGDYTLDTREMRAVLGEVGLDTPAVVAWMRDSMEEGLDVLPPELRAETRSTPVVQDP